MDLIGKFSTEQLEEIRILIGEKITALNGTAKNIQADEKIKPEKRQKRLSEIKLEIKRMNDINEVAVNLINKEYLK